MLTEPPKSSTSSKLPALSAEAGAQLSRLLTPKLTTFSPHEPTPKQQAFLWLSCREAFYGGAAGGGKSDALLQAALQWVDAPGYSALLLRKTYRELRLPGGLLDRAFDWLLESPARWAAQDTQFIFPSGATLTFGYLEHGERDRARYQSSEFQFIGFDELTHFEEADYRYLFSRLRRLEGAQVPIRMRSASNPGGKGHEWVKQRFLIEGPEHGRIFIPARLADNPYLDQEAYLESLAELDPITRAQLMSGDWDVRAGGSWFNRTAIPILEPAEWPVLVETWRYWDLAATADTGTNDPDYTAGCKMARGEDASYGILDMRRARATPRVVEQLIRRTAEEDGKAVPIAIEQEPGSSGAAMLDYYKRQVLPGYVVKAIKTSGSKEMRIAPLASQAEALPGSRYGNVWFARGTWNTAALDEFESFPDGAHDDQPDAAAGAFELLTRPQPRLGAR